jgi:biopolymer transport protein TolR
MLVLLIIFMITAPMMTVGVQVDLPNTSAAQINDGQDPIIVSIDAKGSIYIQDAAVDKDKIVEKLSSIIKSNNDTVVYVRGDRTLQYEVVMNVMSMISDSGIAKVSLIAEVPR